ncbi:hypothetical protein ACN2C6_09090 [Caulobacter sp. ErkDOM-YI]|jgi:hypothetical protein|uniref:hypothetical protein n=1 Tax=unclassified Caulobacter TaxID=2648921 RepID=UPI003AF72622
MSAPAFTPAAMPNPTAQERAVDRVAEASHRLNEAVRRAIDAGYSVELVRSSRFHDGAGNWGDQIVPTVRPKGAQESA